ncbi:hypothetical protein ABZZ80_26605, partial [Streptomyces sp. NPDC006356]
MSTHSCAGEVASGAGLDGDVAVPESELSVADGAGVCSADVPPLSPEPESAPPEVEPPEFAPPTPDETLCDCGAVVAVGLGVEATSGRVNSRVVRGVVMASRAASVGDAFEGDVPARGASRVSAGVDAGRVSSVS